MKAKNINEHLKKTRIFQISKEQDALVLALTWAHYFGLTNGKLHLKYHLRKATLTEIGKGKIIRRNRILNCQKLILAIFDFCLCAKERGDTYHFMISIFAIFQIYKTFGM